MHALVKGSSLVWMEGVGHMPNLESEVPFNDALIEFLNAVPAPPPDVDRDRHDRLGKVGIVRRD